MPVNRRAGYQISVISEEAGPPEEGTEGKGRRGEPPEW
jgi:hypothetical protein